MLQEASSASPVRFRVCTRSCTQNHTSQIILETLKPLLTSTPEIHAKTNLSYNRAQEQTACYSFIQTISIVPLQVHYYSEALPAQYSCCVLYYSGAPNTARIL